MSAVFAKNSPKTARHSVVRPISKIWMLSQECAGLAQAGGLGEAGGGVCQTPGLGSYLEGAVVFPSHGRHPGPTQTESHGLAGYRTCLRSREGDGGSGPWYNDIAVAKK